MLMQSGCTRIATMMALVGVLAIGGVAVAQFGFDGFRGSYAPLPNIPHVADSL